jgi:S-adenosylmethionine hydrolase
VIAAPPVSTVGYIDSFGNLKTTIRNGDALLSSLEPGQRVSVAINGVEMTATLASGSFNVKEGDIALAPGSSGHQKKFWEIFQRGGSAWHTYKKPRPGAEITFKVS